MASSHDDDDEWDKSTSDIQSEDSDDLHKNRPNRWKGPPQSWRTITEDESLTYNALVRLRNQDLSLHLYNAWALKQAPPPAAAGEGPSHEEDVDAETGRPVHNQPWAPPRNWTAWPVSTQLLPPDDFMKMADDEDEVFTFRRPDDQTPRSRLEEVVSATTLRFAKERLRRRGISESADQGDHRIVKTESLASENESQPSESGDHGDEDDDERMGIDQESEGRQERKQKTPVRTFKPVVATDDDLSYDLIRPSTQRILEKFDRTLTILHNAQMTSAQHLDDSEESFSESEDGQDDRERSQKTAQSRRSSRPGSSAERSPSRSEIPTGDEEDGAVKKKSNRGRPRKYVQREGESERDFLIRRAKALKGKVRLPPTDEENGDELTTAAGESQDSPRKRKGRRETMREDMEHGVHKKLKRSNPRDWKDVMGAAAFAGFPPDVIARATQRCANVFGQAMEMHRIDETAISSGVNGVVTTLYQPGGEMPSSSSTDQEDVGDLDLRQTRSMSRHTSTALSKMNSPTSDEESDGEGPSPKKSQKRATSRGKGQHYCPYADCDRASAGFDRPFNLKRHMKLVHGQDGLEVAEKEEATRDEMLDGIHRDGFLQPIRVQKGWRAEDTKKRATKTS
ncbi:RNA polymerase I specific transcription initiation factor [Diaporthe amygdali]|uniref:RNA polymerase I specific transcription initiation factor n=1 Tax=Phomopsis amygdali TaxID=1214568 RepID=UPI0022FDF8E6|nr:RNA polymerase I specific transcription initiation factor [Diaporthe amygdali]KAJ0122243.1 RNA polymerase I specific transcription initiation factor [Diaporthe amygdali]